MSRILLLAVVMMPGLTTGAVARSSTPAPAPPDYERLIAQLGEADYRKRDEATRRLELEGLRAVPALKKAQDHRDPEVRRRVRELLPQLETAALVAPRRVSLHVTDKPLRAVFDEITKQTGYKIEFWTAPNHTQRTYSFDVKDAPFWETMDRVCRDAGLVLQQTYGDDRIILQGQGGYTPHVQHEGAFRFVPTGFQMFRNVEFGLVGGDGQAVPQRNESLTLSFLVFSEPRLPLLGMGEVRLTAAYDGDKNTMLPPAAVNPGDVMFAPGMMRVRHHHVISRYGNGNRSYVQQGQLTLHRPSERSNKVKVVRGVIPVTLLVEQKPVVVAEDVLKAKGKKKTVGTTTFHFEDVSALANKQYQIKLNVSEDNKDNPNDWTWMNTLFQRIELQDDKGNKYQAFGSSWGNSSPNNVQMTLTYGVQQGSKAGPPSKFVFQQWRTMEHQVSFEFKDLPLP